MNDPFEIFEAVYKEWRPPERLAPKVAYVLWPAFAGVATLTLLVLTQAGPIKSPSDKPSTILIEQMARVYSEDTPKGGSRG